MSNRGLGDARETPRSQAFCAHAITSTEDLFIIPDASKDPRYVRRTVHLFIQSFCVHDDAFSIESVLTNIFCIHDVLVYRRFKNNPLVTGPPNIRFYAGAPLIAPENYKLGTFCAISPIARPEGLSYEEKQNLRELSAMAVDIMVKRRRKRERDSSQNAQLIACTAHDLLTPLSGIDMSLSLLRDDEDFMKKLGNSQAESIEKAAACSEVLQDICTNVRDAFSQSKSALEMSSSQSEYSSFNVDGLIDRLYTVMNSVPKEAPLSITVNPDVPKEIISDAPKLFRCALNLLIIACARTKTGGVSLNFSVQSGTPRQKLVVTCEDSAPAIPLEKYKYLFKSYAGHLDKDDNDSARKQQYEISPGLSLFSVASILSTVNGEYGFKPRTKDRTSGSSNGTKSEVSGSTFWFSIPFHTQGRDHQGIQTHLNRLGSKKDDLSTEGADETVSKLNDALNSLISGYEELLTREEPAKPERQKRALVIEDSVVVRKMLAKILTKLGYDVVQAENGLEGLNELKGSLFDVTLCDFLMPVMDGLDCVQQYRDWEKEHRPWFSQKIIGISAHASKIDIEKGKEAGMDDFKPKPVTLKQLSTLLKSEDLIAVSKKLDEMEIESTNLPTRPTKSLESHPSKERPLIRKRSSSLQSMLEDADLHLSCLIISPPAAGHLKTLKSVLTQRKWVSSVVSSEKQALNFLRMRPWHLVLVDDTMSEVIYDYREWETHHREEKLQNITLMSEGVSLGSTSNADFAIQLPTGVNDIIGKPTTAGAFTSLLEKTELAHCFRQNAEKEATCDRSKSPVPR